MRCKACNKLLEQYEMDSINKRSHEQDVCNNCTVSANNACNDNPSKKVQELQESTGFNDIWG